MRIAGEVGLRVSPISLAFWKRTKAKLDSEKKEDAQLPVAPDTKLFWSRVKAKLDNNKKPSVDVPVDADTKHATAEMAAWRSTQEKKSVTVPVHVDTKDAEKRIRYVEHVWKQSDLKRAIRLQVYVAGATALPALSQGIISVTTAITQLSRSALILPGALSGAVAAIATMATGLNGISDALKASNDGMQKSEQYTRQYARAARDLESAQRDVVRALKDANREIQDQRDKLAQGQLGVERARLNVMRANERLAQGGFRSMVEYQDAVLDAKEANLQFSISVKEASRDVQDYYENASRSVTQNEGLRNSLDSLSNSVENFRKAQFQAAGMSEQFINSMRNLSPSAQDFVLQLLKIKGAFREVRNQVQNTLVSGLGNELQALAQKQMPMISRGMQQVAAGINANFKQIIQTLGSPENSAAISKLFERTGQALNAMTPGINSVVNAFLQLSEVGSRFLPRLSFAFNRVADRFEAFIDKADKDGSLERWIDSGLNLLSSLGRSIQHIGSILGSVTEAYERATGNVGGFASTMERGLARLSAYLDSPQGRTAMISWIRTGQEFMDMVRESLPGIRKMIGAIGDSLRQLAEWIFPIFSSIGNFIGDHINVVKRLIAVYFLFRTVKPILSSIVKAWHTASAVRAEYLSKRNLIRLERQAAQVALEEARNEVKRSKAAIQTGTAELALARANHQRARDERGAARKELSAAKKDVKKAQDQLDSTNRGRIRPRTAERNALAAAEDRLAAARNRVSLANKDVSRTETGLNKLIERNSRSQKSLTTNLTDSYKNLDAAQRNLRDKTNADLRASGMWGRLSSAIGTGRGTGITGRLGALAGAFGRVATSIVGGATSLGAIYALDQYMGHLERTTASVDNLRRSHEALNDTLMKPTGSATAETIDEITKQLRDRNNPVHPDDRGQNFDALKILEDQMGLRPNEAVTLALPTEFKNREARLAPADARIIAAVPGLDEWKTWGDRYKANGVDETVYGKALNGDVESIAKVEAARRAIKDANPLGRTMPFGMAANTGYAPNDLGAAQEQLSRSGPGGGDRGLSLAAGALRSVGNENIAAGRAQQEAARSVRQPGLNDRGNRVFGPFRIGAAGALLQADGSAVIELDIDPDSLVPGWTDGARANGIQVTPRFPSGAIITIDPENAKKYFDAIPWGSGYASGGRVRGPGTSTSDSIPAMLSDGEFVINARSASAIGHDVLNRMNKYGLPGFKSGGSVQVDGLARDILNVGGKLGPTLDDLLDPTSPGQPPPPGGPLGALTVASGGKLAPTLDDLLDPSSPGQPPPFGGPLGAIAIPSRTGGLEDLPYPFNPQPMSPPRPGILAPGQSIPAAPGRTYEFPGTADYDPAAGGVDSRPFEIPLTHGTGAQPGQGGPRSFPGQPLGLVPPPSSGPSQAPPAPAAPGSPPQPPPIPLGPLSLPPGPPEKSTLGAPIYQGPPTQDTGGGVEPRNAYLQSVISQLFPTARIDNDYRPPDGYNEHSSGQASDIMVSPSGSRTPEGIRLGDEINKWLLEHAAEIGLQYTIWNGTLYRPDGSTQPNPGSGITANHEDHVHYRVLPGPLPGVPQIRPPEGVVAVPGSPPPLPPPLPAIPAGPAPAAVIPGIGPAGQVPFDPIQILKQIGIAILEGVLQFFGLNIDLDGILGGIGGLGGAPTAPVDLPKPDEDLLNQMDTLAQYYEQSGNKDMADSLRRQKDEYLKQFENSNVREAMESMAQYYDSIGLPAEAAKQREQLKALNDRAQKSPPALNSNTPMNFSGGPLKETMPSYIMQAAKSAGLNDMETAMVLAVAQHESGWNPVGFMGFGPEAKAVGFNFDANPNGAVDQFLRQYTTRLPKELDRNDPGAVANYIWKTVHAAADPEYANKLLNNYRSILGYRRGGLIRGPGTSTSDSIPAMLSDGEFVMRSAAVDHWGVDRLHQMNAMEGDIPGFKDGGEITFGRAHEGVKIPTPASVSGTVGGGLGAPMAISGTVGAPGLGGPGTLQAKTSFSPEELAPPAMTSPLDDPNSWQSRAWSSIWSGVNKATSGSFLLGKAGIDTNTSMWNRKWLGPQSLTALDPALNNLVNRLPSAVTDLFTLSSREFIDFFQIPDAYEARKKSKDPNASLFERLIGGYLMEGAAYASAYVPGLGNFIKRGGRILKNATKTFGLSRNIPKSEMLSGIDFSGLVRNDPLAPENYNKLRLLGAADPDKARGDVIQGITDSFAVIRQLYPEPFDFLARNAEAIPQARRGVVSDVEVFPGSIVPQVGASDEGYIPAALRVLENLHPTAIDAGFAYTSPMTIFGNVPKNRYSGVTGPYRRNDKIPVPTAGYRDWLAIFAAIQDREAMRGYIHPAQFGHPFEEFIVDDLAQIGGRPLFSPGSIAFSPEVLRSPDSYATSFADNVALNYFAGGASDFLGPLFYTVAHETGHFFDNFMLQRMSLPQLRLSLLESFLDMAPGDLDRPGVDTMRLWERIIDSDRLSAKMLDWLIHQGISNYSLQGRAVLARYRNGTAIKVPKFFVDDLAAQKAPQQRLHNVLMNLEREELIAESFADAMPYQRAVGKFSNRVMPSKEASTHILYRFLTLLQEQIDKIDGLTYSSSAKYPYRIDRSVPGGFAPVQRMAVWPGHRGDPYGSGIPIPGARNVKAKGESVSVGGIELPRNLTMREPWSAADPENFDNVFPSLYGWYPTSQSDGVKYYSEESRRQLDAAKAGGRIARSGGMYDDIDRGPLSMEIYGRDDSAKALSSLYSPGTWDFANAPWVDPWMRKVLERWTGAASVNRTARKARELKLLGMNSEQLDHLLGYMPALDAAMDRAPRVPRDFVATRMLPWEAFGISPGAYRPRSKMGPLLDAILGKIFVDEGYMASAAGVYGGRMPTSALESVGDELGMVFVVPEGGRGLFLGDPNTPLSTYKNENEFLLPRRGAYVPVDWAWADEGSEALAWIFAEYTQPRDIAALPRSIVPDLGDANALARFSEMAKTLGFDTEEFASMVGASMPGKSIIDLASVADDLGVPPLPSPGASAASHLDKYEEIAKKMMGDKKNYESWKKGTPPGTGAGGYKYVYEDQPDDGITPWKEWHELDAEETADQLEKIALETYQTIPGSILEQWYKYSNPYLDLEEGVTKSDLASYPKSVYESPYPTKFGGLSFSPSPKNTTPTDFIYGSAFPPGPINTAIPHFAKQFKFKKKFGGGGPTFLASDPMSDFHTYVRMLWKKSEQHQEFFGGKDGKKPLWNQFEFGPVPTTNPDHHSGVFEQVMQYMMMRGLRQQELMVPNKNLADYSMTGIPLLDLYASQYPELLSVFHSKSFREASPADVATNSKLNEFKTQQPEIKYMLNAGPAAIYGPASIKARDAMYYALVTNPKNAMVSPEWVTTYAKDPGWGAFAPSGELNISSAAFHQMEALDTGMPNAESVVPAPILMGLRGRFADDLLSAMAINLREKELDPRVFGITASDWRLLLATYLEDQGSFMGFNKDWWNWHISEGAERAGLLAMNHILPPKHTDTFVDRYMNRRPYTDYDIKLGPDYVPEGYGAFDAFGAGYGGFVLNQAEKDLIDLMSSPGMHTASNKLPPKDFTGMGPPRANVGHIYAANNLFDMSNQTDPLKAWFRLLNAYDFSVLAMHAPQLFKKAQVDALSHASIDTVFDPLVNLLPYVHPYVALGMDTAENIAYRLLAALGFPKYSVGHTVYSSGGPVRGRGTSTSDSIPAMLSDGEFVMSADAVNHWGLSSLSAMNNKMVPGFNTGGLAGKPQSITPNVDPFVPVLPNEISPESGLNTLFPSLLAGSADPETAQFGQTFAAEVGAGLIGSLFAPKGAASGGSPGAPQPKPSDPRAALAPAPTSSQHIHPALAAVISAPIGMIGSAVGQAASTAASTGTMLALAGSTMGGGAALAPIVAPMVGAAAGQLAQFGTQMANNVAVGAANILSALLVGTVTPSQTGQGYGAPLLPAPQQQPVNNFQSIHNGNVVTNNLSEYNRLKDRKDAQKAAPFFNRVNS